MPTTVCRHYEVNLSRFHIGYTKLTFENLIEKNTSNQHVQMWHVETRHRQLNIASRSAPNKGTVKKYIIFRATEKRL